MNDTKTIDFRCDLCGEPATEYVRVMRHVLLDGMRQGAHDMTEIDLCPACAERVWGTLTERRTDATGR